MSKVYIKRKGSAIVTLDDWTEGSIRSKQIMDHDYIKIQFSSIKRRTFKLGDYIETEYGRFEITDKTTINFKVNTETGGYDYTLQFDAGYIKWKNKLMKFTPENEVSELTFSLTATLTSHLELFMQNLNSLCAIDSDFLYNGELEWQISIEPTVEDNAQLIEYDGSNLLDILYTYAEKWKCECWVEGNVICFGRCEKFGDPTVFEYENNVEEITPTDSKKDFATRLYVFGGTRNLPANYRRQSAGAITNGIVQKRLMLPEGVPYLQSNDINEEVEIVEACIFLDEIYPKTDCVVDGVNTYTSTVKNEDDTETTQTFYRIGDSSGFLEKFTEDLILEGETLKVTFTSGPLNLMEFELRLVEDDEVLGKCFEIIANDNYGVFLPDSPLVPEDGDTYVVHGWDSTKIADLPLIHDAEEELLNTGKEHLASLEIDPTNYNCKMDSEWMENDGTPRFMEIGDPVELVCPNMENRVSRIIGYEFSLDMPWRDTKYIVGENAKASKFTALEEKISDVESKLTARINKGAVEIIRTYSRNTPTDNNVFSALASLAQFLNKNKPDAAKELIEFLKGLKSDSIESRKFLEGLGGFGGYGFRLGMDDLNNSHLQVDFLEVMKKAVFAELEVRKRTSIGGNLLLSGATSTIVSVEPIVENGVTTGYKCYIKTDDGTMRTQNNWVEGMQALCQSFNVEAGVYQNVENQYYWRVVTEVGQREPVMTFDPETGEHIQAVDEDGNLRWREAYVVLSNDPAYMDSGCSAPMAEDTIVHCGFNKLYYVTEIDDLDRELNNFPVQYTGVICLDSNSVSSGEIQVATSIRMFDLLTDFNFDSAIQVFGVSRAGTRINSLSFKWTSDVGELTPVIFFGDYNDWDFTKGNIPYFYEVEYGGFRWISINPNGAPEGEIPHEGSKYWKCQKTKGVTYDAYLEHDSDNITVDGDGNVVEGLWEETREGSVVSNVYKLHTAIFAQKNEEFLTLDYVDYGLWSQIDFSKIGGLPHHSLVEKDGVRYRWTNIVDAVASDVPGVSSGWERYTAPDAVGHYHIEITPSDCYAVVKEGMLQIMAIEYVKDGANSSGDDDWTDEQWENMRSMRRCSVGVAVVMDGSQKKYLNYAVNIDHIPTQTIISDIDNQAGSLSWSATQKQFINTTGGIIRSSYKNAPISPYLAADDPTTPDHDESRYNPYVEFVNEQGVAVNVFNGTLSLVDLNESGVSYKGLRLAIAPKNPNSGTAILDGRYTAKVHFVVKVAGVYYEKVITHDILKDKMGVTFELRPSVSQIRASYNAAGALVPSVSLLSCAVDIYDEKGKRDAERADWTAYGLTMKCNGVDVDFGGLVNVTADTKEYVFVLYRNGQPTLEKETVPIIADGKVGEDGGDTEYIYTRTANIGIEPATPSFTGDAATSRIVEDTVDTNGRTWTNHPQGTTTALACEWMSCRHSSVDPNTKKRTWSNSWSVPVEWHKDGDGLEYIYKYTKTRTPAVATPSPLTNEQKKQDGYVPSGWLDEPDSVWADGKTQLRGCNSEYRYLWQCTRKKEVGGNWGDFSDPIVRDHYALDGLSLVLDKQNIGVSCKSDGKPKSATAITVTAYVKYGADKPSNLTTSSTGWTPDVQNMKLTYTYTPNTAQKMSQTTTSLTARATYPDGSYQDLEAVAIFSPVVNGVGVSNVENFYQLGSSPTQAPTGTWKNTQPQTTEALPYLWNYEMIYGDDGSLLIDGSDNPHVVSIYGKNIVGITDYYCVRAVGVTPLITDNDWTTDSDSLTLTDTKRVIWNYELIEYTDGSSSTVPPHPSGQRGDSVKISYQEQYWATTSNAVPNGSTSATWKDSVGATTWSETNKYCYMRRRTVTVTNGDTNNPAYGSWVYSLYGVWGTKGGDGESAFQISQTELVLPTNDNGSVNYDSNVITISAKYKGNAATVTVNSIKSGSAVNCSAAKSGTNGVAITSIPITRYNASGDVVSSGGVFFVPKTSGAAVANVTCTYGSVSRTTEVTVRWSVNVSAFFGSFYHDNKVMNSTLATVKGSIEDPNSGLSWLKSQIMQTAEGITAEVTNRNTAISNALKGYYTKTESNARFQLSADAITLEQVTSVAKDALDDAKVYADAAAAGEASGIRQTYSGIGISNTKVAMVAGKFEIYDNSVSVAQALLGTYTSHRVLYWDSETSKWVFRGTIYADAGEFKGKVTATEGDIGCIHIDGDDYMSVKDSNGNDSVVISQRDIPSYITPFSSVQLAFNSTTVEANEKKSQTLTCNVTTEGGTNNVFSTQFYAPIANRNALSYVGVSLQAHCKITLTKQEDNLWGNTRAVVLSLVAKSGNTVVYRTSPNAIITTSNISATTYHLSYTIYDTSLKYYVEVETRGKQTTSVEVTAYASYSENKTINFLGKNGALFGYSAKKNVRIKQGEMFINGYPALALIANFKVSATGTVTSRYTASGVTVTASKGNYSSSNQKSCYSITVSGLTSGTRPMVFLDGLWVYENNNTNRYTKATLVEPEFNNSTGKLTFKVFTSENDGQRDLPFEAKILDISSFNT